MIINIPLPPKALSPNARVHYMQKASAVTRYREWAKLAALSVKPKGWTSRKVRVSMSFDGCRKKAGTDAYMPRDIDNAIACTKAMRDGLIDAGIVPTDSPQWMTIGWVELNSSPKQHQGRAGLTVFIDWEEGN